MKEFDLLNYMNGGIERVVKNIIKASLFNPKERFYMRKKNIYSSMLCIWE